LTCNKKDVQRRDDVPRDERQITVYKNTGAGPGAAGTLDTSAANGAHATLGFNRLKIYMDSDQNSAANGLVVDQGILNPALNVIDWGISQNFTVTGGVPLALEIEPLVGEYVRVRYTNGAAPTLAFNVLVTLQR
jgi:hypothetical protein